MPRERATVAELKCQSVLVESVRGNEFQVLGARFPSPGVLSSDGRVGRVQRPEQGAWRCEGQGQNGRLGTSTAH